MGVQNEIWVLFEEVDGERFGIVRINESTVYFINAKESFPVLALGGILCNFGVEFFGDAIEGEAVVGGEDEFLFEPEAFLERFDLGKEVDNLGGDFVNEFRCFNIITIM